MVGAELSTLGYSLCELSRSTSSEEMLCVSLSLWKCGSLESRGVGFCKVSFVSTPHSCSLLSRLILVYVLLLFICQCPNFVRGPFVILTFLPVGCLVALRFGDIYMTLNFMILCQSNIPLHIIPSMKMGMSWLIV